MVRKSPFTNMQDAKYLAEKAFRDLPEQFVENCYRHVEEQEQYFWEKDAALEAFENEELEDVEIGPMDEILAGDVASALYNNPSSKIH